EAVPALVDAAQTSAERQELPEALRRVNLALDYNPDYARANLVKGQVLIAQLDFTAAQAALARYLERTPNDADAKKLLELSRNARADDGMGLLALADVLVGQKAFGPYACLMQQVSKLRTAARNLLPVCRKRLDATWPGSGEKLSVDDATGGLSLALN